MSMVTAPAALVKNIYNLGLGQFLPDASRRFFGSQSNIFDAIDFVQQNSGEMRNRQRALQKDFGYQLDKLTNSSCMDDLAILRNARQTYSMSMVAYLDQLTATPVWKAAYDKATVADGLNTLTRFTWQTKLCARLTVRPRWFRAPTPDAARLTSGSRSRTMGTGTIITIS